MIGRSVACLCLAYLTVALLWRWRKSDWIVRRTIQSWVDDVYSLGEKVDPKCAYDWESLAMGYFIGRGETAERARELVLDVYRLRLL